MAQVSDASGGPATTPVPVQASGLLFIIGVGGVLVLLSANDIGAALAQGVLLIALLLVLIALFGQGGSLKSAITGSS